MERPTCGKVKGCRMQFTVVFHREIGVFGPQIGQILFVRLCPAPRWGSAPDSDPKSATLAATIIPVTPKGSRHPRREM